MVGLTLGTLAWMGAAGAAAAQEEGPPPGKVRISLLSPDERALKLFIISGPEGTQRGRVCKLPCEVDLVPGTYRVRFRKRGLIRSWPRSFRVTGSGEYSVAYRSRSAWRKAGAILLVAFSFVGLLVMGMASQASNDGAFVVFWLSGFSLLASGWILGVPLMFMPDKARIVPVQ
jgi:hypothetical protein